MNHGFTVQTMINAARQRTDKVGSSFVADATELALWAAESAAELYDLLVGAYGEEYWQGSVEKAIGANNEWTSLSARMTEHGEDIYKLLRVDYVYNNVRIPLRPFQWSDEILDDSSYSWDPGIDVRYRLAGLRLYMTPRPDVTTTVRIYYVPAPLALPSTLTEPIDRRYVPHMQYIINDLCIKIKDKEESDTRVFREHKALLLDRIQKMAPPRDAGNPQHIPDVRGVNDSGYWWLRGSD